MLALSVPLAFFLTPDTGERFALIGVLFFLLIVELLNTAIEKLSDRVTPQAGPRHQPHQGSWAPAAVGLALLSPPEVTAVDFGRAVPQASDRA